MQQVAEAVATPADPELDAVEAKVNSLRETDNQPLMLSKKSSLGLFFLSQTVWLMYPVQSAVGGLAWCC